MQCPYCGKEMEAGVIQSRDELVWNDKKRFFNSAWMHDNSVVLSPMRWFKSPAISAHLCRDCGKIVIDCFDGNSDFNYKKEDEE